MRTEKTIGQFANFENDALRTDGALTLEKYKNKQIRISIRTPKYTRRRASRAVDCASTARHARRYAADGPPPRPFAGRWWSPWIHGVPAWFGAFRWRHLLSWNELHSIDFEIRVLLHLATSLLTEGADRFVEAINAFIKDVLIQERAVTHFKYNDVTIKFMLDNEFELVFVVIYQSAIQLSYTDKLLTDVRQRFRDMYKNVLLNKQVLYQYGQESFRHFENEFVSIRDDLMRMNVKSTALPKKPRTFQESAKSQKTIESIIVSRPGEEKKQKKNESAKKAVKEETITAVSTDSGSDVGSTPGSPMDDVAKRRELLFRKMNAKKAAPKTPEIETKKKGKQARVWELSGDVKNVTNLDYSGDKDKAQADGRDEEDLAFI
ncbi:signal recognition particle, alpha subunit, partial [Ancylostoma duodenale]